MIRLKNGSEVKYNDDFDVFFQNLLKAIIRESRREIEKTNPSIQDGETLNDLFLRELMDNSIYVTHQLFEIAKDREDLARFMVTGFIFNSLLLTISMMNDPASAEIDDDESTLH